MKSLRFQVQTLKWDRHIPFILLVLILMCVFEFAPSKFFVLCSFYISTCLFCIIFTYSIYIELPSGYPKIQMSVIAPTGMSRITINLWLPTLWLTPHNKSMTSSSTTFLPPWTAAWAIRLPPRRFLYFSVYLADCWIAIIGVFLTLWLSPCQMIPTPAAASLPLPTFTTTTNRPLYLVCLPFTSSWLDPVSGTWDCSAKSPWSRQPTRKRGSLSREWSFLPTSTACLSMILEEMLVL